MHSCHKINTSAVLTEILPNSEELTFRVPGMEHSGFLQEQDQPVEDQLLQPWDIGVDLFNCHDDQY